MQSLTKKQEKKLIPSTERRGHDITGVGDKLEKKTTKALENLFLIEAEENRSYYSGDELSFA